MTGIWENIHIDAKRDREFHCPFLVTFYGGIMFLSWYQGASFTKQ